MVRKFDFNRDVEEAGRQVEMLKQQEQAVTLLGQVLAAVQENNRLLAWLYHAQTGKPVPPPQP